MSQKDCIAQRPSLCHTALLVPQGALGQRCRGTDRADQDRQLWVDSQGSHLGGLQLSTFSSVCWSWPLKALRDSCSTSLYPFYVNAYHVGTFPHKPGKTSLKICRHISALVENNEQNRNTQDGLKVLEGYSKAALYTKKKKML